MKKIWILPLVVVGVLAGVSVARWEVKYKSSKHSSASQLSKHFSSQSSSPSSSQSSRPYVAQPSPSPSPSQPSPSPSPSQPSPSPSPSQPSPSPSPSQPSKSPSPSYPFVSYPASQFSTVSSRPRPYAKGCPVESTLCNDGTIVNTPCGCAYHNGIRRIL